ncbi:MAG: thiamine diphosphokinase [Bacteroidetes bacterium]|nr:thiamine diphosphokinase [Bacteroidota bacterium]
MKKTATIFLNGSHPGYRLLKKYIELSDIIIAADGGGNFLRRKKILPHFIIGDLDSLKNENFDFFKKKNVRIIKIREQETTDFEKCINFCRNNKISEVYVLGASGQRPDHTLNNISVMKRYYKEISIKIISEEFEIFFIKKRIEFDYPVNETVSILAMPVAKNIFTSGLKYRLSGDTLEFGVREGTLNVSAGKKVSISFKSGNLLLFKKHFIK